MEIQVKWSSPNEFVMQPKSPNPYEMFLLSFAINTGQEMLIHFKEHKTTFKDLSIKVKGTFISKYQTKIFNFVDVLIECESNSPHSEILNAVEYSQFLTSGISAMMSKMIPINWKLEVNGEFAGEGIPNFEEPNESVY